MCLSDSVFHFLSVSVSVHLCLSLFTSNSLCAPSSVRAGALPVAQLLPTYNQLVSFQNCKPVLAESEKKSDPNAMSHLQDQTSAAATVPATKVLFGEFCFDT